MSRCVRVFSALLLCVVLSSCSAVIEELIPDSPGLPNAATKSRMEPGPQTLFIPWRLDRPRLVVTDEEFRTFLQAVLPLIRSPTGELGALPPGPAVIMVPVVGVPLDASILVQHYVGWCERRGLKSDCVGVLHGGLELSDDDKPRIAFDLALGSMGEGFKDELRKLGDPNTIRVIVVTAMVGCMAALAVPTGVSQAAFAGLSAFLIAYLGFETVWNLIAGYLQMEAEAKAAKTFGQLREAGEKYGKILGGEAAKVFIMLVLGAISEGGLLARLGMLPKAAQASTLLMEDTRGMLDLQGVGNIRNIKASGAGATITLAPAAQGARASAMAMAARGTVNAPGKKVPCREEDHHIATPKNSVSTVRGGPWTPEFEKMFNKAGLSMENKANIVNVYGHVGPHPQEYHQTVYTELRDATYGCISTAQCREKLLTALAELAKEVATPGTQLNDLITKDCE